MAKSDKHKPPFLTELDPEIAVKGSIDPLGFMIVWSRFGREVVRNLTTITSSARQFTTVLLGFYFARKAIEKYGLDEDELVSAFLEFEQLADYSRYAWDEQSHADIRGIRRVSRYFHEGDGRVLISAGRDGQIMSNQKAYGLYGLYTVAATESGLVDGHHLGLMPEANDFVESYLLPRLNRHKSRNADAVMRFLRRDKPLVFSPAKEHEDLARPLADLHRQEFSKEERDFYFRHLVCGGPAGRDGRQTRLWELIDEVNRNGSRVVNWVVPFGMVELMEVSKKAEHVDPELAARLQQIRHLEHLIGPAYQLFNFVAMQRGQSIEAISEEVERIWPTGAFSHLRPGVLEDVRHILEESALGKDQAERIIEMARRLRDSDYTETIRLLLDHNRDVMARRGGGPWAFLKDGLLEVRYRYENASLPEAKDLPTYWFNNYFLDSLKSVGKTVLGRGAGHG